MTWGFPDYGGNSSGVKDQLKGVQQVEGAKTVFVATVANGSIVTWGGGRSRWEHSAIADQAPYL